MASLKQRECLAWLRTNVVECRGVELSPQQLQQLSAVVGDDAVCALRVAMGCRVAVPLAAHGCCCCQTLAHTAMVAAAMTGHGEVVSSCATATTARPWLVAPALLCVLCSVDGVCALECTVAKHGVSSELKTSAVLAASVVGDLALLRRLVAQHTECGEALRGWMLDDAVGIVIDVVCL
jgi:hypothetical protein